LVKCPQHQKNEIKFSPPEAQDKLISALLQFTTGRVTMSLQNLMFL